MLYLLFRLGDERYALPANRVVEVVPLVALKKLPGAPKGVAGIFNYRGRPVPAVDLGELTLGRPAEERLSTRIIVVNYPNENGQNHPLGLIAERATEIIRRESGEFRDTGLNLGGAPYVGPVLMDSHGGIHLIDERRLLPEQTRDRIFCETLEQSA